MNRKLILDSSDEGRTEICYDTLSIEEIESRIQTYEKKYGMPFPQFFADFSSCCASPDEMRDYMDWDCLTEEHAERLGLPTNNGN